MKRRQSRLQNIQTKNEDDHNQLNQSDQLITTATTNNDNSIAERARSGGG